ncbi:UBX domain-containing protein 6 [Falco biarmicus]|uniref:UBX domain-containing protein 6 n=1 Tax=Falco rusticolus TaxID=120794 RepID=UPI0018866EE3|nr:UBX domain-containing protein 6 [Falco rusticolus]XP_055566135.1 UBX domain-containing protein 6 [Falco cherrug]XP_056194479.1 UBX domain-containing protein 6 [Falco biarmicus]
MRKFFQEIKADLKFKTAGPGQKLSEPARAPKEKPRAEVAPKPRQGPTDEAQMAAAAALARLELRPKTKAPSSQEAIRSQVRKELMAEAAASEKGVSAEEKDLASPAREGASAPSVSGVYFICPLTGAVVKKDKKEKHLREAIQSYFSVDPVAASIMEIHTFNKDREKVRVGVETMARYLDNICLHPEEEKYRKIKLQNKVFQERISCLEGIHRFFQAVGFETKTLPVPGQETTEEYYVLKEEMLTKLEELKDYKEQLLSSEPVRAQLDRQLCVFKPSPEAARFELPNDFYNLTAEEIKREQRLRTEAVEKASMLRTRAMREKEEQREMRKYNYTLVRVRFPDGYILQGTFYARESLSALYNFVREALRDDWLPFELLGPGGLKLTDENLAFNECGLVPSALLTLAWDAAVMADIEASGEEQPANSLKPEILSRVQTLS